MYDDKLLNGDSRSVRRPIIPLPVGSLRRKIAPGSDFDTALSWARLAAAQSRKSPQRVAREAKALQALGPNEEFLAEFLHWRESEVFTPREKAAMELSEAISLGNSNQKIEHLMKNARRLFKTREVIQLLLSIHAIKEWHDANSLSESYVLIVQDGHSDRELILAQIRESLIECIPIFVQRSQEALDMLRRDERHLFRSRLIAIVIDVHLPHISAADLLQSIPTNPDTESLPVIVITSSLQPGDVEECDRWRLSAASEPTVTLGSFFAALTHIARQSHPSPNLAPIESDGQESRCPDLSDVYDRLRNHFQQSTI